MQATSGRSVLEAWLKGLPGSPVVKTLRFHARRGAQVRSLVRELRSLKPQGTDENKKKNKGWLSVQGGSSDSSWGRGDGRWYFAHWPCPGVDSRGQPSGRFLRTRSQRKGMGGPVATRCAGVHRSGHPSPPARWTDQEEAAAGELRSGSGSRSRRAAARTGLRRALSPSSLLVPGSERPAPTLKLRLGARPGDSEGALLSRASQPGRARVRRSAE